MEDQTIDLRCRDDTTINSIQTNFRIDQQDANVFRTFCVEQGITQATGFRMLMQGLESAESSGELPYALESQKELQAKVNVLKKALHKVTVKYKEQAKRLKRAGRRQEMMKRVQAGIACCKMFSQVLCKRFLQRECDDEYEMRSWEDAKRSGAYRYVYPQCGGIQILTVDFLYYENARPGGAIIGCFSTNNGEELKLRIWPKEGFTPLCSTQSFYKNDFISTGRRWLCAYEKMKHGYIELICAIPAPDCFEIPWEYEIGEDGPHAREIQKRIWLKEIEDEVEWNRKIQEEAEQEELNSFDDLPHDEEKHPALADVMSWAGHISKEKR